MIQLSQEVRPRLIAGRFPRDIGYLCGFADAQTRRELKPQVGQLFADDSPAHPPGSRRPSRLKGLDGVDEALHALLGLLLDPS